MQQVKLKFFVMPTSETHAQPQKCDFYGCTSHGQFKAPKSRSTLQDYYWFCLPHIRDYNARWDYFKDMDRPAIEAHIDFDNVWQRPTHPFGTTRSGHAHKPNLPIEIQKALQVLELQFPFTLSHLKDQYKSLVKENHPDLHDQDAEKCEKLKAINWAYEVLQDYLSNNH